MPSFTGEYLRRDLTFTRTTAHRSHQQVNGVLGEGMSIHQTDEAAASRIETDGFAVTDEIELDSGEFDLPSRRWLG